jgi:predicted transposase YdaD
MYYPELAERMRLLKGSEKEVDKMALTMDQLIEEVSVKVKNEGMKEGRKEGRKEGKSEERTDAIRRMLRKWSVADVLDLGYTMEEIRQAQS